MRNELKERFLYVPVLAGHIHKDKPDASICSQFLLGKCSKGIMCLEHHCSMPYHWQYKVSEFAEWESFRKKDNLELEKLYCDLDVEASVDFKLAQSTKRQVHRLSVV